MSRRQVSARVDDDIHDGVEQLQRDMRYGSKSDAARDALEAGLAQLGYLSEGAGRTPARRIARHVSHMLFYVAAVLLVLSATTTLAFTFPAIGVLGGSVGMRAVDRWVLRSIEPAVTNRLPRVEVNRR